MKKNKLPIAMFISIFLLLTACNSNEAGNEDNENEKYKLTYATINPTDHIMTDLAYDFAEAVADESDGRLEIEVFPDGQLGGEMDLLEQLQSGDVDMTLLTSSSHSTFMPQMSVAGLPFLFDSHEVANEAIDGELGDYLFDLLEDEGIKGLAWQDGGFLDVSNNKRPIEKPSDFEGIKMRVPPNEQRQDSFIALGASPESMDFTELYSALQQKVVDGQNNGASITYASKFHEVQDYFTVINLSWSPHLVEMNMDKWNSLPDDLQSILQDNAIKYSEIERDEVVEDNNKYLKLLEEEGMEINTVEDLEPFQEAVQPVYEKYSDVYGEELMNIIDK